MTRDERLQALLSELRRRREPAPGRSLAAAIGCALRTLCRDVARLRDQGVSIVGEHGAGYALKADAIPPLRFSATEIEALVQGAGLVAANADPQLAAAARAALSRLKAALPREMDTDADPESLPFGPGRAIAAGEAEQASIRAAIRQGRKLAIVYRDPRQGEVRRMIWPFALEMRDGTRVVAAWCEAEAALRPFRTDRIQALALTEGRYPRPRQDLLRAWRDATPAVRPQAEPRAL